MAFPTSRLAPSLREKFRDQGLDLGVEIAPAGIALETTHLSALIVHKHEGGGEDGGRHAVIAAAPILEDIDAPQRAACPASLRG